MIDYSDFENSLKNLQRYHEAYKGGKHLADSNDLEELAQMGLIQSFEVCYETILKALRRHLTEDLGVTDPGNGAKLMFRTAGDNGLLSKNLDRWLNYVDARNTTSHDYSLEKLLYVLELIPKFIADAIELYQAVTGIEWES
ncbi:MAG: nucleotidyltransferase substrate binding protein [Gammaproteobacteria bacterium AqS3]|nr:nucleotidyltransferase substrate binding protein [Gammaproteobacteria bacterium AqS3]